MFTRGSNSDEMFQNRGRKSNFLNALSKFTTSPIMCQGNVVHAPNVNFARRLANLWAYLLVSAKRWRSLKIFVNFTYFITYLGYRHPGWNIFVEVKYTWNGVVVAYGRSFHTGKVQSRRGRRTSIETFDDVRKMAELEKDFRPWFQLLIYEDVAFDEKFTVFGDQRLFRARSVNLREECFPSEIIHAKICGESHWS